MGLGLGLGLGLGFALGFALGLGLANLPVEPLSAITVSIVDSSFSSATPSG